MTVALPGLVDDHDCSPDSCVPCERTGCAHLMCKHRDYGAAETGECLQACECLQFIAGDDCEDCDGTGVQSITDVLHDDLDRYATCETCGGNGVFYRRSRVVAGVNGVNPSPKDAHDAGSLSRRGVPAPATRPHGGAS